VAYGHRGHYFQGLYDALEDEADDRGEDETDDTDEGN